MGGIFRDALKFNRSNSFCGDAASKGVRQINNPYSFAGKAFFQ